jgi:hypothetical protein
MYNERFQGEGAPDSAIQDGGLPNLPKAGFPANYLSNPALQHAFDQLWANAPGAGGVRLADRFAAAWAHVAAAFRRTSVLGYELFNEPWPGTAWAPCAATPGCPAFDVKLKAFYERVFARVRAVDRRQLIWYEPNVLFNGGANTYLGPILRLFRPDDVGAGDQTGDRDRPAACAKRVEPGAGDAARARRALSAGGSGDAGSMELHARLAEVPGELLDHARRTAIALPGRISQRDRDPGVRVRRALWRRRQRRRPGLSARRLDAAHRIVPRRFADHRHRVAGERSPRLVPGAQAPVSLSGRRRRIPRPPPRRASGSGRSRSS